MAKIHGLVYIAVGLFVSIFSWKVNYEKFVFFFYAGLVFVFVGVMKLIFGLIKRKMSKTGEVQHITSVQSQHQAHHYKRCHKCGNIMKMHDRFCSRCGAKV
ncbi:zinc ribbon domain-containing protein [Candidatus Woesearchaeota archaeon]|nr:zinc ribbon domain-containing protein [Candidatus Woesearchaeota archaeon]